jgi:hypothetical protein
MSFTPDQLREIYSTSSPQIENTDKYIRLASQQLTVATMNSIRRTLLLNIPTVGFVEHIDPADYKMLNKVLAPIELKGERHTVVASTAKFPIPMLAHRLSRIPISSVPDIMRLLVPDDPAIHVFLLLSERLDYGKPLKNEDSPIDMRIYARDLQPLVIRRTTTDDGHVEYERVESLMREIAARRQEIFPFNTFLLPLGYGQEIHAILRPQVGTGVQDPRWAPCTYHYRFNRDARHGPAPIRLHKEPDLPGIRLQFAQIPAQICERLGLPKGMTYDRHRKPFEIELMAIYNGRMPPDMALKRAIGILKDAVELFLQQYNRAHTVEDALSHEDAEIFPVVKEQKGDTQSIYVPFNTNDPLPAEYQILASHTIGNLLASKMLYIVERHIIRDDALQLYEGTLLAYKIPHHLVQQCLYTMQLPVTDAVFISRFKELTGKSDNFHEELIKYSVQEIIKDLQTIRF